MAALGLSRALPIEAAADLDAPAGRITRAFQTEVTKAALMSEDCAMKPKGNDASRVRKSVIPRAAAIRVCLTSVSMRPGAMMLPECRTASPPCASVKANAPSLPLQCCDVPICAIMAWVASDDAITTSPRGGGIRDPGRGYRTHTWCTPSSHRSLPARCQEQVKGQGRRPFQTGKRGSASLPPFFRLTLTGLHVI